MKSFIFILFFLSNFMSDAQSDRRTDILEIKGLEVIDSTFAKLQFIKSGKLKIKFVVNYDSIPEEVVIIKNDFEADFKKAQLTLKKLRFYPPLELEENQKFIRIMTFNFKKDYRGFTITQPRIMK